MIVPEAGDLVELLLDYPDDIPYHRRLGVVLLEDPSEQLSKRGWTPFRYADGRDTDKLIPIELCRVLIKRWDIVQGML